MTDESTSYHLKHAKILLYPCPAQFRLMTSLAEPSPRRSPTTPAEWHTRTAGGRDPTIKRAKRQPRRTTPSPTNTHLIRKLRYHAHTEMSPSITNGAYPPPYIVEPTAPHTSTMILLHDRGSDGAEFGRGLLETGFTSGSASGSGYRTLPALLPGTRFLFPTVPAGVAVEWFDAELRADRANDQEGQLRDLATAAVMLRTAVQRELSNGSNGDGGGGGNIPARRIVLGGFGQGCAVALSALLSLEFALGGFVGLSGYLPFQLELEAAVTYGEVIEYDEEEGEGEEGGEDVEGEDGDEGDPPDPGVRALVLARDLLRLPALEEAPAIEHTAVATPVFLGHGEIDAQRPRALGEAARLTMRQAGYDVRWRLYPGLGHWYRIPDEIDDVVAFLRDRVGWDIAGM
ncbi:putative acyl-protein thioesterase [Rosellinia necatrix]|uniref:Putative acyl-protein thioesterase n=1 Tax=Rosellinia necatrix TaxID=77044 RepID=A0A1W2TRZ2_ROSNE|nr:putative acyl-protein thioesterase [Rosellinia necatrix]